MRDVVTVLFHSWLDSTDIKEQLENLRLMKGVSGVEKLMPERRGDLADRWFFVLGSRTSLADLASRIRQNANVQDAKVAHIA